MLINLNIAKCTINYIFASHCLIYFQILFCFWSSKQENGFMIFWNISLAWSGLAACRIVGLGDVWDSQTNHTVSGGYQQFQYFPWSFSNHTVFSEYQQIQYFQWSFKLKTVLGEYQQIQYFWWSFRHSLWRISTVQIFSMISLKTHYLRRISTVPIILIVFYNFCCCYKQ